VNIATAPAKQTVVAGANVQFNVSATGLAPLSYQWLFNGSTLTGQTNSSLLLGSVTPAQQGPYAVRVSNVVGSVTSPSATLTVQVPPSISSQPQSLTNLAGTAASFQCNAAGTSPLAYQWLFNGNALPGASSTLLTLPAAQPGDAGSYSLVVTNVAGAVTSAVATLTVWVPPTINSQPVPTTNLVGTTALFTMAASGTQPLSYQWLANGVPIDGAVAATLAIPGVQPSQAGNYFVIVANVAGSITSAVATLTVWVPPSITSQPQSTTNLPGTPAILSASASGTQPLSYQWWHNGSPAPAGTDSTLNLPSVFAVDAGD